MMTLRACNVFLVAFFFGAIAFSTNNADEATTAHDGNPKTTAEGKGTGAMVSINIDDNCHKIGSIIEDFKKAKNDDERRALYKKLADIRLEIYSSICEKLRSAYHGEQEGYYIDTICDITIENVNNAVRINSAGSDNMKELRSDNIWCAYMLALCLYAHLPGMVKKMKDLVISNKVEDYRQKFSKAIDALKDIKEGLNKFAFPNSEDVGNEYQAENLLLEVDRIFMGIAELLLNKD